MQATVKWLASLCDAHLLSEKWLLVTDLQVGNQWKDQLNLAGTATINLHARSPRSIAISFAAESLAERGLSYASFAINAMVARNVFDQLHEHGRLRYFGQTVHPDGLANLFAQTFHELRMAKVDPGSITASDCESEAKADDLQCLYHTFLQELANQNLVDLAGCIQLAIENLNSGRLKLPADLLLLAPEKLELSALENELLERVAALSRLIVPNEDLSFSAATATASLAAIAGTSESCLRFVSAVGEANEIRGVFEQLFASVDDSKNRLDQVEIVHTDTSTFVPIVVEQLSTWLSDRMSIAGDSGGLTSDAVVDLPVTFSDGIPAIYSRPGRALRGWLRWIRSDFSQTRAVQLLREGVLVKPPEAQRVGYARLADTLRKLPIGFGFERYMKKMDEAVRIATASIREYEEHGDRDQGADPGDDNSSDSVQKRDFGLGNLLATRATLEGLLRLSIFNEGDASQLLLSAKRFLLDVARSESQLDRAARNQLLDEIDGMRAALEVCGNSHFDVRQWLEELPVYARFLRSGPRPGCVHVAPLRRGGYSGRSQLFVVGLDDRRIPQRPEIDPILLDAERQRISPHLPLSQGRADEANERFWKTIRRVVAIPAGRITFSYSVHNLAEERACLPSSVMLDLFRASTGDPTKHIDDLITHTQPPTSFVSRLSNRHLSQAEAQLSELLKSEDPESKLSLLDASFPHLHARRRARHFMAQAELSPFDGYLPDAGATLDPANIERVSASRLETYGACPRRYFLKYGLGVYPPEEWVVQRETWLDALQFGNLVHQLFEDFLRELTQESRVPSLARDRERLRAMLRQSIDQRLENYPVTNQNAFTNQCSQLEDLCDIFLEKEETYCREQHAVPWVLEASMGLRSKTTTDLNCDEPIPLTLSDGRIIRACGRMDRVDKLTGSGSERYAIWDYKSGSTYGYQSDDPFPQGRKLQPFLYFGMLRHRLAALGRDAKSVASFGYFFPNPRSGGIRMQWTEGTLKSGDVVLRQICDSIAAGVFVATTDPNDCTFCDYQAVCGEAKSVAKKSLWKVQQNCNTKPLKQFRTLRKIH